LQILDPHRLAGFSNPFPIICGTSAGAINAAALACLADHPQIAVCRMRRLWSSLTTDMVYRSDAPGLIKTGVRWLGLLSLGWLYAGLTHQRPQSLLDNQPLRALLERVLHFGRLQKNLSRGHLAALAITASSYTSAEQLIFYQSAAQIESWHRFRRQAVVATIAVDHLLASSAIPFIFPAQALDVRKQIQWCGDGSIRQLAPLSAAIHLGADRVLAIGTNYQDAMPLQQSQAVPPYPSLAQVGGQILSSIFVDSLAVDVERLERINYLMEHTLGYSDPGVSTRRIKVLTLSPSEPLDAIALEHFADMPAVARALFRVLGVSKKLGHAGGGALISYLLFESRYLARLIALGYADTMRREEQVQVFFKGAEA
jgi:NTE family protein